MELAQSFFPASAIDKVIPVRDQIVYGASCVTERNTAIHAARTLSAQLVCRKVLINFEPVVNPLRHWAARGALALMIHEARRLTHAAPQLVRGQVRAVLGCKAGWYGPLRV